MKKTVTGYGKPITARLDISYDSNRDNWNEVRKALDRTIGMLFVLGITFLAMAIIATVVWLAKGMP